MDIETFLQNESQHPTDYRCGFVAIVGRPNVGKSTLFNRLTRTKDALVHDLPGLTRDRHYGHGKIGSKPYLVIDTGGFEPVVDSGILHEMAKQTLQAVDEADAVVFLVDGRTGLTPQDKIIADRLRQSSRPVYLAVNKGEGGNRAVLAAEFYELALGDPYVISGAHGDGVYYLIEDILETFPEPEKEEEEAKHPVFAVIGRPNVGKSTLVNAILGEERVIAFDMAGTTRDSIHIDFEREGKPFTIIDTAGVRRRGKVDEAVEKFSVIKAMQAVEAANVAVLVLDAQQDIADQDATIAGFVLEAGRAERKLENDVAIVRVEQLYPFPYDEVRAELAKYPNAKSVVWAQEEPKNQGAFYQIRHRIEDVISEEQKLSYAGRPSSASPAVGYSSKHIAQLKQLVEDALAL